MSTIRDLEVRPTALDGCWVLRMKEAGDERGTVREFYRRSALADLGIGVPTRLAQVNATRSGHGALRGIHAEAITKVVMLAWGTATSVIVDLRPDSPTAGRPVRIDMVPGDGLVLAPGLGNSFQTTSPEGSLYLYGFDEEWRPGMPGRAATPLDPALAAAGIHWPVPVDAADRSRISHKDATAPTIAACLAG